MESDKEKKRNVVCATTADASQAMIVLSSNRRYTHAHIYTHFLKDVDMKTFYFGGQTSAVYAYHSSAPPLFLSSHVFLYIFITLCVH